MQQHNYSDQYDEDYGKSAKFFEFDRESDYQEEEKTEWKNIEDCLFSIMEELYDNTLNLRKEWLHENLIWLCKKFSMDTVPYDFDLLSVDHYKEKYRYNREEI